MTYTIDEKVKRYIAEHTLISRGDRIVVGVSGGADSMMLLHFLNRHKAFYDIDLQVAHIHHGLRDSAEQDMLFVEEIGRQLEIPCAIKKCEIKALAKEWQMTEEEAGRKVRYDFFISLTNGNAKIATAHNMNDQAETLLMRFIRGTEIQGLGGIPPKRENIIRPILGLTREEVEYYCNEWGVVYRQDETNFQSIYTRNKIRLECIPYIEREFNPNFIRVMSRQAENYKEADEFLKEYTCSIFEKIATYQVDQVEINKVLLQKEKPYIQKRLFLEAIFKLLGHTKEITTKHIQSFETLINNQTGKKINIPFGIIVSNEYEKVVLEKSKEVKITNYEYPLQMGTTNVKEAFLSIKLQFVSTKTFEQRQQNMYTKFIDYDKIKDSLQIRNRQPSDYITLPGGTKKLKKFFGDEKIPQDLRNTIPLIADGKDIVWVIGSRLNSKYYITDKTTQILELTVLKEHTLQEGLC